MSRSSQPALLDSAPLDEELAFLLVPMRGAQRMFPSAWAGGSAGRSSSVGEAEIHGRLVLHRHRTIRTDGTIFETFNVFQRADDGTGLLLYGFDSLGYPPEPAAVGRWHAGRLEFTRESERGAARTVFEPSGGALRWGKLFRAPGAVDWQPIFVEALAPDGVELPEFPRL